MFSKKEVIAVIPARGGSKGIPRKNLYRLGGQTLLERSINLGQKCAYVDRVFVSTENAEIYEIARRYGVHTPRPRPAHLATDDAKTIDVVVHVLDELGIGDAYVLLLQVTSPLKTLSDLNALFAEFESKLDRADAIVSLTEHDDPHPNKIQKIENGYVSSYLGGESMVPRQSLPKVYRLNGAFYLTHAGVLRSKRTFLPKRTVPFIMSRERSLNLDSMMDIYLLEALITKNVFELEEYGTDASN